jgi:4-diphosphocytidyl-2-C-methyl-D-erythritol kinase
VTLRGRRDPEVTPPVLSVAPGATLRARAPAKVNLSLLLGGVRPDGRHELVTVFESISLCDELVLSVLHPGAGADEVICPGVEGPNLVASALAGLRAHGWEGPRVRVRVRKRIPVAAGMGGGSADAAATLRLAAALREPPGEALAGVAAELGADVPGQLSPGVAIGRGAGDLIEPVAPLEPHAFVIVPLPLRLSTADVFHEGDRLRLGRGPAELESALQTLRESLCRPGAAPPAEWAVNDLEPAALSLAPEIEGALQAARSAGSQRVLVCGSGPTVAGLFAGELARPRAQAAAGALASRYPGARLAVPVDAAFGAPRFG